MLRTFMNSKIHRATVTESNLHYVGSITIALDLMGAAGIGVHELVQIVDIDNGERFETYTIAGAPGSGQICVNGAAARLVQPGDKIIVISYAQLTEQEIQTHRSTVVHVDGDNEIQDIVQMEPANTLYETV
ncbi:aspartate 1-decarboxylase [Nocardia sp. CA2R105]|uniref:aspartate 1-decarboxylase n=1 Tax=Nocardia coffeae TaxID=2873381 RepID=UPI001CA76B61|nr:aspartate 1-decarboxylase [Nocardia coffeae]MBY8863522.1 aspartate 1-decarboxylase [Nocardia coffeae]